MMMNALGGSILQVIFYFLVQGFWEGTLKESLQVMFAQDRGGKLVEARFCESSDFRTGVPQVISQKIENFVVFFEEEYVVPEDTNQL